MKKLILMAFVALTASSSLSAQSDSASLAAKVKSENAMALRQFVAHPVVVAKKMVPRTEAYMYFNHLDWVNLPAGADTPVVPVAEPAELYFTRGGNVLFSSMADGSSWSTPSSPSELFENAGKDAWPIVTYNGRALYFSSKSLYGIGGYDIYRCDRDPRTGEIGTPQNLGYPFNSDADDFLCSETPDGKYIMFASSRDCPAGQVNLYVVEYENYTRRAASESEVNTLLKMNPGSTSGKYSFAKGSPAEDLNVTFAEAEPSYGLTVGGEGAFAEDNELPAGLVYQIQIYVLGKPATVKQLKGISPVYDHKLAGGKHLYAAGLFRTYAEAKAALPKVKNAGFPNSLIIAYRDGKSLSVNRARQLESEITIVKEEVHIVK